VADYEQEFLAHDGQRLGLHRYRRNGDAVILLPAMGVPAGYYRRFALQLAANGLDVTVADLRGTGASQPKATRRFNFGYRELIGDVDVFLTHLHNELAGRRVLLAGHSLGGQLASLHLAGRHLGTTAGATNPLAVHGLALLACGLPYHGLYGGRSRMIYGMAAAMTAAARMYGHWPGHGFAGRQPRQLIDDWRHTIHKGSFVDIDGTDLAAGLAKITLPLLAVTMHNDKLTPPAVSRRLTDLLSATQLSEHHYTSTEAGGPLDHFKWAHSAAALAERITSFVRTL
jgi:predicted alpha/beta hydrolase